MTFVVLGLIVLIIVAVIVSIASPRLRPLIGRTVAFVLGGLLGLYLVGRGIAEFWVVDYGNPASYRDDWGGPSLAGVFAVHTGPGFLVIVGAVIWFIRWRRSRHLASPRAAVR